MERFTTTRERSAFGPRQSDSLTESAARRLEILLRLNASYPSACDDRESVSGTGADHKFAFSLLGLALGLFPPSALFLKFIIATHYRGNAETSVIAFFSVVVAVGACAGYFSGKVVGNVVRELEAFSWPAMLAVLPFVGVTWGIIAGGIAGAVIFLIGAIPGALIGGAVGAVALPVFGALHRVLKKGDEMELRHLYPISLGVAAVIAAFFLALPLS